MTDTMGQPQTSQSLTLTDLSSHPACLLIQANLSKLKEPLIIGIAGDSGSGKTRLSNGIRKLLGDRLVKTIEMDGYHKENREQRKASGKLPLDPSINNLELLKDHLSQIKQWKPVQIPIYNHETGDFDPPQEFKPTPIVIVEGLHALYSEFLPFYDFSIYVDASREIKWMWKKGRDTSDRGHDTEALEQEMFKREAAYKRWIDFQKTDAMIVVKIFPSQLPDMARYQFLGNLAADSFKIELLMEPAKKPLPSLILPFDLAMIMDFRVPPFLLASVPSKYWGRDVLDIHIDGEMSPQTVEALAGHLESCTGVPLHGGDTESTVRSLDPVSSMRFTQLLITWRFLELINQKLTEALQQ